MFMPRSPISASFSMAACGTASLRSHSRACGANSPRQSSRTASRIRTWSSVRSRFMRGLERTSGGLVPRRLAEYRQADDPEDAHDARPGAEEQRAEAGEQHERPGAPVAGPQAGHAAEPRETDRRLEQVRSPDRQPELEREVHEHALLADERELLAADPGI